MNRLLFPFAAGFRTGLALRRVAYRKGLFKTRWLTRPVVSIGNVTVGGTGKTPLVMYIAERLLDRGWTPSILTRGYGRRSRGLVGIPPQAGRRVDPRQVGDEPAMLAMTLPKVPIVVGANRHRAGVTAEENFTVDVHLLDDGFQHWSLGREADVVTIDVTQDLSHAALLPAGRFREPPSALRRADIVVLTRTELADPAAHREFVTRINPTARIFASTITLRGLIDVRDGSLVPTEEVHGARALAFCGIGNPKAFFSDLRRWGFEVAGEVRFRDHHQYGTGELHRLAARAREARADFMLTTEKDLLNLPVNWKPELPVLACVARLEIEDAGTFEDALINRLRAVRSVG